MLPLERGSLGGDFAPGDVGNIWRHFSCQTGGAASGFFRVEERPGLLPDSVGHPGQPHDIKLPSWKCNGVDTEQLCSRTLVLQPGCILDTARACGLHMPDSLPCRFRNGWCGMWPGPRV